MNQEPAENVVQNDKSSSTEPVSPRPELKPQETLTSTDAKQPKKLNKKIIISIIVVVLLFLLITASLILKQQLSQKQTLQSSPTTQKAVDSTIKKKSHDLSSITLQTDETVNILITNPVASRSGVDKIGNEFSEIKDASYYIQLPLANDINPGKVSGENYLEFFHSDPISGVYSIEFNTDTTGVYSFELYAYNREAEVQVFRDDIEIKKEMSLTYRLEFDKDKAENFASFEKVE